MLIRGVSWRPYRVPLRGHFTTAHGAIQWREGIIVAIATAPGITGVGEIAPLSEFGGGNVSDALALLPEIASNLRGQTTDEALAWLNESVGAGVDVDAGWGSLPRPGSPHNNSLPTDEPTMPERGATQASPPPSTTTPAPTNDPTACGVEMALLDALGKERGCSVGALLAPSAVEPQASVRVNAVIGARDAKMAAQAARQAAMAGYRCVKLKVGMEQDAESEIARIAQVRAAIGADVALRLDANEAWHVAQAQAVLSRCASYNIQYVEQPLPRADLDGLRALRAAVDVPLAVDEALDSLGRARALLADHAAAVFVMKPQIVGGLRVTRQIIDEAAASGVQCVISSAIESGVGLAALLHLVAALPAVTLECGLATGDLLADDLIVEVLPVIDGAMAVPRGPGLGVSIDEEAMKSYGYERER